MNQQDDLRWYALHVRSRHEKSVHAQLVGKDQEVFLPLYNAKKKWADRYKEVSLPLFPGYVFCRFDSGLRSKIFATSGVIDVVRAGKEPAPIACAEIEALQVIVNSGLRAEPYAHLVTGSPVRMTSGPFAGRTGKVASIRNNLRLIVSVELLCRSVLVEIDAEWVTPLKRSEARIVPAHRSVAI